MLGMTVEVFLGDPQKGFTVHFAFDDALVDMSAGCIFLEDNALFVPRGDR